MPTTTTKNSVQNHSPDPYRDPSCQFAFFHPWLFLRVPGPERFPLFSLRLVLAEDGEEENVLGHRSRWQGRHQEVRDPREIHVDAEGSNKEWGHV